MPSSALVKAYCVESGANGGDDAASDYVNLVFDFDGSAAAADHQQQREEIAGAIDDRAPPLARLVEYVLTHSAFAAARGGGVELECESFERYHCQFAEYVRVELVDGDGADARVEDKARYRMRLRRRQRADKRNDSSAIQYFDKVAVDAAFNHTQQHLASSPPPVNANDDHQRAADAGDDESDDSDPSTQRHNRPSPMTPSTTAISGR